MGWRISVEDVEAGARSAHAATGSDREQAPGADAAPGGRPQHEEIQLEPLERPGT
jgi:hypothetical protein